MTTIIQLTIFGVLLGGIYALTAMGLTLVYGVMRIINLAHAAFVILGSYIAFVLFRDFGIDPFVSILVTAPSLFLLGIVAYRLLFEPLAREPRFAEMTVLLSFGIALGIEGTLGAGFGGIYHRTDVGYSAASWDIGEVIIPLGEFYGFLVSLALLGLLSALLYLTRTGYAIRATMQDRTAAEIVGVNVGRISTLAFGIGAGLAGAAGSIASYLFTFFPAAHWQNIALLLSLVVVGGIGSLRGTLVAGVLLSVIAAYASDLIGPTWSQLTFYLALFVVLLVRPQGLFGRTATVS